MSKPVTVEASYARVSEETRAANPQILWHQPRGMRNLLVHAYSSVDWEVVWVTATDSAPGLAAQVAAVLRPQGESPTVWSLRAPS